MRLWHKDPSAKPLGIKMPPETQELSRDSTVHGTNQWFFGVQTNGFLCIKPVVKCD